MARIKQKKEKNSLIASIFKVFFQKKKKEFLGKTFIYIAKRYSTKPRIHILNKGLL